MADSSSASTAAAARARREARKSMRRMQTTGVDSTNNDAPPSPDRRNRSSLRAERRALGLSREMSSSVDLDSSPSRRSRLGGAAGGGGGAENSSFNRSPAISEQQAIDERDFAAIDAGERTDLDVLVSSRLSYSLLPVAQPTLLGKIDELDMNPVLAGGFVVQPSQAAPMLHKEHLEEQLLTRRQQQKQEQPDASETELIDASIPLIAMSPRLQDLAVSSESVEANSGDVNRSGRQPTQATSFARCCGVISRGGAHSTGMEEVLRGQSEWLLRGGEGVYTTSMNSGALRFVARSGMKERIIRDLVALVHRQQHFQRTAGAERREKDGNENGDEEESKGPRASSTSFDSFDADDDDDNNDDNKDKLAVRALRARGFATLDDILDASGELRVCDNPILPFIKRVILDAENPEDGAEAFAPPPRRLLSGSAPGGSGDGGPGGRLDDQMLHMRASQTIVRPPSTGVGPSILAHSMNDGRVTELVLAATKLAIYDHPLFCEEDRLAANLRTAYGTYHQELEENPCVFYGLRLAACVDELARLADLIEAAGGVAASSSISAHPSDEVVDKLVARAYPPAFNNDLGGFKAGENPDPTSDPDAQQTPAPLDSARGRAAGSAPLSMSPVDLVELLWTDALETLNTLTESEQTARRNTKQVYRLWRRLQTARVDAARRHYGDAETGGGGGGAGGGGRLETIKATPMRLKLVEVPTRALEKDQVEVLPAVKQLQRLHESLSRFAIEKIEDEKKRRRAQRSAEAAAAASAVGGSEHVVRTEIDELAEKEEMQRFREARNQAKLRHKGISEWLKEALKFFSGGAEPSTRNDRRNNRRGNRGGEDDNDDDEDRSSWGPGGDRVLGVGAGRFKYLMKLTTDEEVTPRDQLPDKERIRRDMLGAARFYFELHINDSMDADESSPGMDGSSSVVRVPPKRGWCAGRPDPTVGFTDPMLKIVEFRNKGEVVRLRVLHRPHSVKLRIFTSVPSCNPFAHDELLAEVPIPLPGEGASFHGVNADALAHQSKWFQFSQAKPLVPSSYALDFADQRKSFDCCQALARTLSCGMLCRAREGNRSDNSDGSAMMGDGAGRGLLGDAVGERTSVEQQLLDSDSKRSWRNSDRHLHGVVLVGVQWAVVDDGYLSGIGSRYSSADEKYDANMNKLSGAIKLPGEKFRLETGRLQGFQGKHQGGRPWEKSNLVHDLPVPSFAKESDFVKLLPPVNTVDPNDPRNFAILRVLGEEQLQRESQTSDVAMRQRRGSDGQIAMALRNAAFTTNEIADIATGFFSEVRENTRGSASVLRQSFQQTLSSSGRLTPLLAQRGATSSSSSSSRRALSNPHVFKEPLRHTLLKVRHMRPDTPQFFKRPIPLSDKAIERSEAYRSILNEVLGREERRGQTLEGAEFGDDKGAASLRTQRVEAFVKRVRDSRLASKHRRASRRRPEHVSTVVQEAAALPPFRFVFDIDELIPAPAGRLRPGGSTGRASSAAAAPHTSEAQELRIQIVSAENVPLREHISDAPDDQFAGASRTLGATTPSRTRSRFGAGGLNRSREGGFGMAASTFGGTELSVLEDEDVNDLDLARVQEESRVTTFLQIHFKEQEVRTNSCSGRSPHWKETVAIPLDSQLGGLTPVSAFNADENIYLSLFDEVLTPAANGRGGANGSGLDIERRFLGSVTIPFSTVYESGKIDGFFRLDRPIVNLGYSVKKLDERPLGTVVDSAVLDATFGQPEGSMGAGAVGETNEPSPTDFSQAALERREQNTTYVRIIATVDPPVAKRRFDADMAHTEESRQLQMYGERWIRELRSMEQLPSDRLFSFMAPAIDGKYIFIPRFLSPAGQKPPLRRGFPREQRDDLTPATVSRRRRGKQNKAANSGNNELESGPGRDEVANKAECARFVSLVPFVSDYASFRDMEMWCTSRQFLEVLAGDEEEHALLLWHYFTWLNVNGQFNGAGSGSEVSRRGENQDGVEDPSEAESSADGAEGINRGDYEFYLVLGRAIPEGETKYVMQYHRSTGSTVFWNACTGEAYNATSERCPLVDIGCLVTPDNIYANIQKESRPSHIARRNLYGFNVLDRRFWRPFFEPGGKKFNTETCRVGPSVQEPLMEYAPPVSIDDATELAGRIQDRLRDKITVWRTTNSRDHRQYPVFFPDTKAKLLLKTLEHYKLGSRSQIDQTDIRTATGQREVFGVTLNFTYTDMESIEQRLKSTGVHETTAEDVLFLLAVHCEAFPCGVVSVWVFYGTLPRTAF